MKVKHINDSNAPSYCNIPKKPLIKKRMESIFEKRSVWFQVMKVSVVKVFFVSRVSLFCRDDGCGES